MKQRVYVDTSVIGGCLDEEFSRWSKLLFDEIQKGRWIVMISDVTNSELTKAPIEVKEVILNIDEGSIEQVSLSQDAELLASNYIAQGIVGEEHIADAEHIAIATIEKADVLVSWNFKHIVNMKRIHLFNAENLKSGYNLLEIRTPREVVDDEKEEGFRLR